MASRGFVLKCGMAELIMHFIPMNDLHKAPSLWVTFEYQCSEHDVVRVSPANCF